MDFDVVLLPTFAQAESWQKSHAGQHRGGLFSQTVTTFDAWMADLWELQGDGRALVDAMQREMALRSLLESAFSEINLPGMAPLAAAIARDASGCPAYERALQAARDGVAVQALSQRESSLLELLAQYEDALASCGLVELGVAAALLAERSSQVFPLGARVLMAQAAPATLIQDHFFTTCANVQLAWEHAPGADKVERVRDGIELQFAFPSGKLAEPGLVGDVVCERSLLGDVVVVAPDPLQLAASLEARLLRAGLRLRVQGAKPFSATDFGKAVLAHYHGSHDDPWTQATLSDAVSAWFSGFSPTEAALADKSMRQNRLLQRDAALFELGVASERFSQLQELVEDPDADVLIGLFEQQALAAPGRSPAWRAEQLAAAGALRDAMAAARLFGADMDACMQALERVSVAVSYQVGEGDALVTIASQQAAARMPHASCATVVACDLTSQDYPVLDRDDAASTLLEKLGLMRADDALARARRAFHAVLSLPTAAVVLMRPLGDANADETYPSAVLEDLIDAYRDDLTNADDIDNAYRLPDRLQENVRVRGEELLYANACASVRECAQPLGEECSLKGIGTVLPDDRAQVAGHRAVTHGDQLAVIRLSPSQIESYVECPFKWFATSRLRIEGIDEGFGPLERGSFAHEVLETFYRRFQQTVQPKVDEASLAQARELMGNVFDELAHEQQTREPGSGRYVARTEMERRQLASLRRELLDYLELEAQLLPAFHPAYFEYKINEDQALAYAGGLLVGTVDRIDVDGKGNAVVIDYKGSLTSEHEIADKSFAHPGKVQTRIYAQAIRRALGLNVVGALYVSYGRNQVVAGAYDARVIEAAHVPACKHDKCRCGTESNLPDPLCDEVSFSDFAFDAMLDATEARARNVVSGIAAGEVAPNPVAPGACAYCPVAACEKRGA